MIEENHEKTSVRLVGTGIWTRDIPNASLVRYHGATSLGEPAVVLPASIYIMLQQQDLAFQILTMLDGRRNLCRKPIGFFIGSYLVLELWCSETRVGLNMSS